MVIFNKIAKTFRKIVIGYVFYTFPATLIGFFILAKYVDASPSYGVFLKILIYIAMAQFAIWTLVSLLFSISMFFSKNNREIFLKKLSGIKERDEREVQIAGKALRANYLSTMTILLFLLFISLFHMEFSVKSADNVEPDKPPNSLSLRIGYHFLDSNETLSIGFEYHFLDSDAIITQSEGYDDFFKFHGIPVSTSGLILILLIWQIVSYRYISKRSLKMPD